MRWEDISEDGVWTIPGEKRQKGTAGKLKFSNAALEIIHAQPRMGSNRMCSPVANAKEKAELDRAHAVREGTKGD
jgi:hypothetical protein